MHIISIKYLRLVLMWKVMLENWRLDPLLLYFTAVNFVEGSVQNPLDLA